MKKKFAPSKKELENHLKDKLIIQIADFYKVTRATVSRRMKELKLTRVLTHKKQIEYNKILTKEFLINEYCKKKKFLNDIAFETKIDKEAIITRMKKFGIQRRKKGHEGYITRKNMIGVVYGKLKVLSFQGTKGDESDKENKTSRAYWLCECQCGQKKIICGKNLRNGSIKSCGCSKIHNKIPLSFWHRIIECSKLNKLEFNITEKYIEDLFHQQRGLCRFSGVQLKISPYFKKECTASLDRIDSNKGYIEGNVQWVHKWVNIMKQDMTDEEFIDWCRLITKKCIQDKIYNKKIETTEYFI